MGKEKKKQIEFEGMRIELTKKENGYFDVQIANEALLNTIEVGEDRIWDANVPEELKYVPESMRSYFLEKKINHKEDIGKAIMVEIYIDGFDVSFYFSKNKRKKDIPARFTTFGTMEMIREYLVSIFPQKEAEIEYQKVQKNRVNFEKVVEENGLRIQFAHGMDFACYGYWDILIDPDQWEAAKFEQVVHELQKLDDKLEVLEKEWKRRS